MDTEQAANRFNRDTPRFCRSIRLGDRRTLGGAWTPAFPTRTPRPTSARAPRPAALAARRPAAPRARRRQPHPALRRGRRGARPPGRAPARPADDRPRLDRRHRRPLAARVRPRLPPDLAQRAPALGADRQGDAPRRVDAADRRLPGRRAALRRATATTGSRSPASSASTRSTPTSPRSITASAPATRSRARDLPLKSHERLFFERVPLPPRDAGADRARDNGFDYAGLAEGVEAWGFRAHAGATASS